MTLDRKVIENYVNEYGEILYERYRNNHISEFKEHNVDTLFLYYEFLKDRVAFGNDGVTDVFSFPGQKGFNLTESLLSYIINSILSGELRANYNRIYLVPNNDDDLIDENVEFVKSKKVSWINKNNYSLGVYKNLQFIDALDMLMIYDVNVCSLSHDSNHIDYTKEDKYLSDIVDTAICEYIMDKMKKQFKYELDTFMSNVAVLQMSSSAIALEEGCFYEIFTFIYGYNMKTSQGEAMILTDFCR
ncbi:MAG TPA: hypothetical protein VIQ03_15830 [Gammaproteobacteria bacterium]